MQLIYKANSKIRDGKRSEEKKQKKIAQAFKSLLRNAAAMKEGVNWEEIRKEVMGHTDFGLVEGEDQRIALFNETLGEQRERGFVRGEEEEERRRRKDKDKKRHRSRKHDRSSGSESEGDDRRKRHRGEGGSRSQSRGRSSPESE